MKYEFILENKETYNTESNTKLLLIKELLQSNKEKIRDYYDENIRRFIRYDHEGELKEGRIVACRKSGWGFLDASGKEKVKFIYDSANSFSEGLAKVSKSGKTGFIDKDGNIAIPFSALFDDYVGNFHDGLALLRRHSKYGYINKRGRVAIPTIYENANSYSEGLASVCKNNKWGFINSSGRPILPFIYDDAKSFNDGISPVKKDDKWGCIDKTGKLVVPFIFDEISDYHNGLALAINNHGFGFINKEGKEVVPCIYFVEDMIKESHNDIKIENNYLIYKNEVNRLKSIKLTKLKEKCLSKYITNITKFCEENYCAIYFDLETKEIALVNSYTITDRSNQNTKETDLAKKKMKKKYNRIYF